MFRGTRLRRHPGVRTAATTEVDRDLAATLQSWLLPADLPTSTDSDLATALQPGRVALDVGGDWYDVVRLDERRTHRGR